MFENGWWWVERRVSFRLFNDEDYTKKKLLRNSDFVVDRCVDDTILMFSMLKLSELITELREVSLFCDASWDLRGIYVRNNLTQNFIHFIGKWKSIWSIYELTAKMWWKWVNWINADECGGNWQSQWIMKYAPNLI